MSLKCPFIRYMNILMEVMTAASAHSGTYMPKKEEARQHLLLQMSYKDLNEEIRFAFSVEGWS